ncbi:putative toxin-antitoxin system toxin component, PIN family [Plectonema cf. radiosum LEGE 06105]|uniref:Putative toxin-antitoxin system toxin component, PIN family n=1 Tax=Plectonema cf. radiosum LEGE 06105 TaxID=945769 RepID=A0A8J7F2K9_9CYAN|nr:putative toxin-antitoxin system toxin component, PIN family [Plectonema radiosum]MBE9211194.1 putative toxin-antitoxin system toxin component, PIN family [Plectonema cf. radiosum LEGE 06105]
MPDNKPIKAIIDTNLWISFLIGKQLASLKSLLVEGTIQPVFSQQLLDEITIVTQKPKLQKYFSPEKVIDLIIFLESIGLVVEIKSSVLLCRDVKDNYLLALAKDSQADYLITGDEDLLILDSFEGTVILNYQSFLAMISQFGWFWCLGSWRSPLMLLRQSPSLIHQTSLPSGFQSSPTQKTASYRRAIPTP